MSKIKAISLDDMDEMPNPLGVTSQPDDTMNRALSMSPAFAGENPHIGGEYGDEVDTGTMRQGGGGFQLSESFTRFSQVLGLRKAGGRKANPLLLAVLSCGLIMGGLYLYLGEEYFAQLLDSVSPGEEGATGEGGMPTLSEAPANEAAPQPVEAATTDMRAVDEIPGNPYWKLPNPAPVASGGLPPITSQQTENWRAGLNHPFPYQRLKSTQEMRKNRVEGSVAILYEALAQPKFWTRMEALQGIADQGVALDNESLKTGIGDARSDLVKNYFKRFRTYYSETSAHLMRQALRVVDGQARLVILSNLAQHRGEVNDQYLYAASLHETDAKTKAMVTELLGFHPVPAPFVEAYKKSMSGNPLLPGSSMKGVSEIKVEKIPSNMNIEEVYFINDQDVQEAPPEAAPVEKKEDDGFNDLQHTDRAEELPPAPPAEETK